MGYRKEYNFGGEFVKILPEDGMGKKRPFSVLPVILLAALVLWPQGREVVREGLIPGENEVTMEAAEIFAAELRAGCSLEDALMNFCREVIGAASD